MEENKEAKKLAKKEAKKGRWKRPTWSLLI